MWEKIFIDISLVTVLAVVISYITRLLKQPLIIGYIITWLIVSLTWIIEPSAEMWTLSQIGIALLLFMVGLWMNPKVVKDVWKISLFTGVWQVIFTSLIWFIICWLLGFDPITSAYISVAIAFSSTIVIMKLLSDKGDLNTLYGKISLWFLIIQDVIAMLILMFISFGTWDGSLQEIVTKILVEWIWLITTTIIVWIYVLPKITKQIAKSQEFLELFAIGWCLILASIFHLVWFSIEVWALIAWVTLSMSPYRFEISSKMKPLRDFFIVIFFVLFGTHMTLDNIWLYTLPIIILSLFVLIWNPIIVMTIMWTLGYKKKTWFKAWLTVAQISEFSFILIILWANVWHLNQEILSLISIVWLITIAWSTYFILYADKIYNFISPYLSIFEKKKIKEKDEDKSSDYEIVLFGYNNSHFDPINAIKKLEKKYLIVDDNPEIIKELEEDYINCLYWDASDIELLDEIVNNNIKMVISSSYDIESNHIIIEKFKNISKNIIIIVTANTLDEAMDLYHKWATYVLVPHFIKWIHISELINNHELNIEKFIAHRENHIRKITKNK